jgi:peptide/nickel transport system substrate-binding protein
MMYALDRQAMADSLMQGYSQIADMYIAPSDPLFPVADRAITKYAYDPSRAAQLLGQAGWRPESDGLLRNAGERFDFEVRTTQDVQGTKEAQLLADMWKRVGLNTSIFVIPRTEQRNQEYRAKFPGMTTTSIASVEAFYYTSDTIPHEGNGWQGTNRGGYSSAEADRLDHAYFTTIGPVQRRDVLIEILRFVSVELPYLAFYYNVDTHAVRAGLHGIGSRYDRQPGMAFNIYDWYWE